MALSTIDIDNHLKRFSEFKGVFAIDKLPFELFEKPFGIVINLDPSWKPGSHWTALFVSEYGHGEYFDSFGTAPPDAITCFLERNCKNDSFSYNQNIFQGDLSIKCGYYCILFLESHFNNLNFPLIKCKPQVNDYILNKFY